MQNLNPKTKKGLIAEHDFVKYACSHGLSVAQPLAHDLGFDFLCWMDGGWKKIQVKCAYYEDTRYVVSVLRSSGSTKKNTRKYTKEDCDYFYIYAYGPRYLIPIDDLDHVKYRFAVNRSKYDSYRVELNYDRR